jgi:hypothetical protein
MSGPLAGGVRGDIEMHHPASMVGEDQEDEQHLEADSRDGEEIDRHQVFDVVIQEHYVF